MKSTSSENSTKFIDVNIVVDKLAKKSKLTKKKVDEIAHKINREVFEELDKR
ncbi:hypothetical protein J4434_01720 [Candidatus Woesearchaeota archaeon]|nr:hypothetical protein [Candidatus Woesearchaeota archaeon]